MSAAARSAAVDCALETILYDAMGDYGSGSYEEGSAAKALSADGLLITDEVENVLHAARIWSLRPASPAANNRLWEATQEWLRVQG